MKRSARMFVALAAVAALPAAAEPSDPPKHPSVETLQRLIVDKAPQTRVETPDHERITARRIDIVDDTGVIRMTLSGKTPAPIIDGLQYKRAFNLAGPSRPRVTVPSSTCMHRAR